VESAKNEILEKMWKLVGAAQWTSVTIGVHDNMEYFPVSHRKLLDLAKVRDVDGVVAELKNHFQAASDAVVTAVKKQQCIL
jgi:DNA-binding GntR family transcriptional regulator